MDERVALVDEHDREIGSEEKLTVHRRGTLHRAVSVFVFDRDGRLLLQRRAATKYHSAGRWSNTCCGHPRPGESPHAAARRRLREEMGFDCPLEPAFTFVYRAEVGNGLEEHEYDHVFAGRFDGVPEPDAAEVADWRWETMDRVRADQRQHPDMYTVWFGILLRQHHERLATWLPRRRESPERGYR